ncbi:MAG TPA: hypothetical protein VFS91_10475, partial [Nitrobacter sp.]|nr:hypothetical protein [Nitrobacter sp.]
DLRIFCANRSRLPKRPPALFRAFSGEVDPVRGAKSRQIGTQSLASDSRSEGLGLSQQGEETRQSTGSIRLTAVGKPQGILLSYLNAVDLHRFYFLFTRTSEG